MERLDLASRHMSNARRHLIAAHREAYALAISEVRLALASIGEAPSDADLLDWVRRLRAAVDGEAVDAGQFMDAVDGFASFLFFRDLATA